MIRKILPALKEMTGILFVFGMFLLPKTAFALGQSGEGMELAHTPASRIIMGVILLMMFSLLVWDKVHRTLVAGGAATLVFSITYLTPFKLMDFEGAMEFVDWNVIFLLFGMMAIIGVLKTTNVFPWLVYHAVERAKGEANALFKLVLTMTGLFSAFLDNVTTVLFMGPIARQVSAALEINTWAFILPMIMASNIGGTATLIGDPPNVLIGSRMHLTFMDFIMNLTVPVIYMTAALLVFSKWFYKSELKKAIRHEIREKTPIRNTGLLKITLGILVFVFAGFITHSMTGMPVAVPAIVGAIAVLIAQDICYLRKVRPKNENRKHGIEHVMVHEIEWLMLFFFIFLFIVVGAAVSTGLVEQMTASLRITIDTIVHIFGISENGNVALLVACLVVLFVSAFASAILDNIPFTIVAIPVVATLASSGTLGGNPSSQALFWALALGACLGGNGTLIGASANVTAVSKVEKEGLHMGFTEFMRFGMPVMGMTVLMSGTYLTIWIFAGSLLVNILGLVGIAVWTAKALLKRHGALGDRDRKASEVHT